MGRYFFNIYNGIDIFDESGTVLRDAHEVRLHMIALAKIWINEEEHQDTHWSIEARDDRENIVGLMSFEAKPAN